MDGNTKERSSSLTAWIILLALANGFSALIYGFMWLTLVIVKIGAHSNVPIGTELPTLALTSLVALVFIYGIHKWKKWGVYGFAATNLIAFSIYMKMGQNNIIGLFGLLGIGVLIYMIRPYWNQLETF